MSEMSQLANAMLALVFAAIVLVTGQLHVKRMSAKTFIIPLARTSSVKQSPAVQFRSMNSNPGYEADQ
jgi:hypothetical protein